MRQQEQDFFNKSFHRNYEAYRKTTSRQARYTARNPITRSPEQTAPHKFYLLRAIVSNTYPGVTILYLLPHLFAIV
ncbi:MAG: hypothetical protein RBR64_09420, partial [Bacteroidales bacterium]|nr:hypothetical protein [Bacteroidales bacterium]